MSIVVEKVDSLSDYFNIIKQYSADNKLLWFRGHASSDYVLAPSIYRKPYEAKDEQRLMDMFKSKGVKFFSDSFTGRNNHFAWLFIMQHYGTPTRLLDWSENAMVAIQFATQYRPKEVVDANKDAVVWCLNPFEINNLSKAAKTKNSIVNICEDEAIASIYLRDGAGSKFPIAVLGSYNSERIVAQKGVFTLFPLCDSFSMEDMPEADKFLYKIVIPNDYVKAIADELYFAGYNELSLFPEPESISKEIARFESIRKVK